MPPTFAEYQALLSHQESQGRTHIPALETALGLIKTAAVSFEHLTNDPHWDRFLSYLQGMLDQARKDAQHWMQIVVDVDGATLQHAQRQYHAAHAQVLVLERIMSLPHELKHAHDEIKAR